MWSVQNKNKAFKSRVEKSSLELFSWLGSIWIFLIKFEPWNWKKKKEKILIFYSFLFELFLDPQTPSIFIFYEKKFVGILPVKNRTKSISAV